MKVLITGANGLLGYDIIQTLKSHNIDYCGISKELVDLSDIAATSEFIRNYNPNVIIHCAAFTNVDLAETNPDACKAVNVDATANIALLSKELNIKLVYISTDYVFSGDGIDPYHIDSEKGPLSVYGRTKLEGEYEITQVSTKFFIIRTSWAFGTNGRSFVNVLIDIGRKQNEVNVVSDQIGSPTYTKDLANLIVEMIKTEKYGVYHATNEGFCSRAEFAEEIFRQLGYSTKVNHISSDEYPSRAKRPKNSRLSKESLDNAGFKRLPTWQESLRKYLSLEMKKNE